MTSSDLTHQLSATLRKAEQGEVTHRRLGGVALQYAGPDGLVRLRVQPRPGTSRIVGGRRPPADVLLDDASVSAAHFELELVGNTVTLRDLGSTNGTWIYGVRVREVELSFGARFSAGSVVLEVGRAEEVEVAASAVDRFEDLFGSSPPMQQLYAVLTRLAPAQLDAFIHGETGTGKELVARALHRRSARAAGPFVVLDCSTVPHDLAESAILGHAAGAFTGASRARAGCFEEADGGTLFLDEIGELPMGLQAKLLRVLAEREVQRIGESTPRPIDVRVVSATHRNLLKLVLDGRFREDLYHRLAQYTVELPALRKRGADIELLARRFLTDYSIGFEGARELTPDAIESLREHRWAGNVRELRNVMMRAAQMTPGATIDRCDLALANADLARLGGGGGAAEAAAELPLAVARAAFDREYLAALLARTDGNVTAAARIANISRRGVYEMLTRLGMSARWQGSVDE